jgi:hypothetical protein
MGQATHLLEKLTTFRLFLACQYADLGTYSKRHYTKFGDSEYALLYQNDYVSCFHPSRDKE